MRKAGIVRIFAGGFCFALLFGAWGCQNTGQDDQGGALAGQAAEQAAAGRQVTGTVRHIDLEGGFYGIETDEGVKLDPVNLPAEFQKDGLRIRARVETLEDRVSFHMWGRLVRILDIERL